MKFGDRTLRIPTQIWAVLDILGGGDFSFYGLKGMLSNGDLIEQRARVHDVFSYPFYNFDGHAYGFVFVIKSFKNADAPVLYFTITQHGSCDNICIIDWLGSRDYRNPPLTNRERPEGARMASFNFGQVGHVLEYVRTLIALFLMNMAGEEFTTDGVIGIENANSEYGKRVL